MGGSIDDQIGTHRLNGLSKPRRIGEIAAELGAVKVQCHQFTQGRQAALQFPAELPALAEQQNPHVRAA